jgi:hypothetical protein
VYDFLGKETVEQIENYYRDTRIKGEILSKMKRFSERLKQELKEDHAARPIKAKMISVSSSNAKGPGLIQNKIDKMIKNSAGEGLLAGYTIKKKPTATGQRIQASRVQAGVALGKREPLESGQLVSVDSASLRKQKPGDKLTGTNKSNLVSLVKSELQSAKEGTDFFYQEVYRRSEKRLSGALEKPVSDTAFLKR